MMHLSWVQVWRNRSAKISRTMVTAEGDGVIEYVDALMIRILYDRTEEEDFKVSEPALKEYRIPKFRRTNQNMTIDLRPIYASVSALRLVISPPKDMPLRTANLRTGS